MIRTDRFRLSDRPYAVDLNSLTVKRVNTTPHCHVDAAWVVRALAAGRFAGSLLDRDRRRVAGLLPFAGEEP